MTVALKVPSVGESVTEVEIGQWLKNEGAFATEDEPVVVIETEKATLEVPAPVTGEVTQVLRKTGEKAAVGDVIGYMEEAKVPAADKKAPKKEPEPARPVVKEEKAPVPPAPPPQKAEPKTPEPPPSQPAAAPPAAQPTTTGREERVLPMSPIRRKIAERLVESQNTAALLTTFNEVEMSAVQGLRAAHQENFQKKHQVKLGLMSFFVKAAIEALRQIPQINAEVRGGNIVFRDYYDIGIAIGGGKGLVVPVLRNAERLSFAEIEKQIADFAQRAREDRLKVDELQGGTFTISNGGIYGSLLSTPIVNPPQSGVLGMHAIEERPVVRNGQIVARPMMYVALTYDHRIVDGREAVTFLKRVKELIEDPARLLLDV